MTVPATPPTTPPLPPRLAPLPIDEVLDGVCASLRAEPSVVLRAPTGSGKTTRVPGALLDRGVVEGAVWVSQPRRVAARAAARRIAEERGVRLGDEVGYQVRYEKRAGAATRIVFLTDGLLLRRLQADPLLEGVGALVFDEVHERRLDTDLTLALARQIQREMRPDLRIVVMSATLDAQPFARFLGDCPTIDAAGRAYEVTVDYLAERDERRVVAVMATHLPRVLAAGEGDVLAFLPGVGEIDATAAELARAGISGAHDLSVVALHGSLPPREQDAALAPRPGRKVILATNVAETSLTIPGIRVVVDGGWARVARYDSGCGLDRLELERISRASAEQRAGRAGREAPGRCLRLWTRGQQADLTAATTPEVARVDLASAVLELLLWGERDPLAFAWLEAPPEGAVARALELLERLGATEKGGLTALGKRLAARPLPPRLARVLLAGEALDLPEDAALLAALLAERDPFRGRDRDARPPDTTSDTLERLDALRRAGRGPARAPGYGEAHPGAVAALEQAAAHLARGSDPVAEPPFAAASCEERLGRALLAGYPDRVAARRREDPDRAVLVGGRGVRLAPSCGVREAPLFVCVELDAGARGERAEALVRQAWAIERAWLPEHTLSQERRVVFSPETETVRATQVTRYLDLVLDEKPVHTPTPAEVEAALVEAARADLGVALGLDRPDLAALVARVEFVRRVAPEIALPALDDAFWGALLPALCSGQRSLRALREAPLEAMALGLLHPAQARALDELAPTHLALPDGSRARLDYGAAGSPGAGGAPVLAARIQQLYGMSVTPTVARGTVPVLLHLLAPNHRPQQITDDLAGFWRRTYGEVRKELAQRYPKHYWPDDPSSAQPRPAGANRRRR